MFELLLCFPEMLVDALLPQQPVMRAALCDCAVAHDIDAVCFDRICKAVRDENNGFLLGQPADLPHDDFLALGVDAASRLIEYINRRIMQHGASQCETLALSAGEIAAEFCQLGIESLACPEEVPQRTAPQNAEKREI